MSKFTYVISVQSEMYAPVLVAPAAAQEMFIAPSQAEMAIL